MAETPLKPLKAILETIRERADYALQTASGRAGTAVNGMEMQKLRIYETFHPTRSVGGHRKMPQMQKHFV